MFIQSQNFATERALRFQLLEKTYTYPKHVHQFVELVILLGGELVVTVDGRKEKMHPNEAALIFPFQPHSYSSKETNKIALFTFSPSLIPDFFTKSDNTVGCRAVFTPRESTLDVFKSRIFPSADIDLYDIKGAIYLALGDFSSQVELCSSTAKNEIVVGVVNYVRDNITDDITLGKLAKALGYNPNYLSQCISECFGINLCTLIASIRADKAKRLLFDTNMTGLEICYECGFGSERSFHRQFKAITGKTPKQYRTDSVRGKINHGTFKYF